MVLSRSQRSNATLVSTGSATRSGRRKTLALPFVMTAVAACGPRPAEEPGKLPAQDPHAEQEHATPVIISNPPRPEPAPAESEGDDPETRTAPADGKVAPAEPKPVIMRNPPPPRPAKPGEGRAGTDVKAVDSKTTAKPTETSKPHPEAPATGGHVVVRDDGTCWWHAAVKCPPNTRCNPPPPNRVQCPEDKK